MCKLTILVADDFFPWRARVRDLLLRPEWHVFEASNGLDAVERAMELRPDIVLLDIGMPILNGLEAAERIREAAPYSRIIFLSQEGDAEVKAAAFAAGGDAYLSKADAARELLSAIETALRQRTSALSAV
jgi:DNA-binding response OmpR family regulator